MSPMTVDPELQEPIHQVRECLQELHFLHRLRLPALDALLGAILKRRFKKGDVIVRQGEPGDSFYMVAEGSLTYYVAKGRKQVKVAELDVAEYFGEAALLEDKPRAATVVAETDGLLFLLRKADFRQILMENPAIAAAIQSHFQARKAERAYALREAK